MHDDIVTFQYQNQAVISSRHAAKSLGKTLHHITRDILDLRQALNAVGLGQSFDDNFWLINEEKEFHPNLDKNPKSRRGRPKSKVWIMNADGFFWLATKYNTPFAMVWKNKVLFALKAADRILRESFPKLKAEIERLQIENASLKDKPKALPGLRTGMISAPVLTSNLWGEDEIVGWELRPKDTLDEYMLTLASLRHCNRIAEGLEEKKRHLTDTLVNEEMNRRASVTDLTERRFKLLKSKKNK